MKPRSAPYLRLRSLFTSEWLRFLSRKGSAVFLPWLLAALVIGLIGWLLVLSHLETEKVRAEQYAHHEAGKLARNYADHLTQTISAIDQLALSIKYGWEMSDGQLQLDRMMESGLFIAASDFYIGIFDRNGDLVTNTVSGSKRVNLAEKPVFLQMKNAKRNFLYIGDPAVGTVTRRNIIRFARRIEDKAGNFDGIILLSVSTAYFTSTFESMGLTQNDFLGVMGADTTLRVSRIGNDVYPAASPALEGVPRISSASGTALWQGNEWFADRRSRYVGWAATPGYPLIALTGLDEQEALEAYREHRASSLRNAAWATLALLAFTVVAMTLGLRLAWRKHLLERTQATYRMATEVGTDGVYIGCPVHDRFGSLVDLEFVDCNRRGAELLQSRREDVVGRKLSFFYRGHSRDRFMEWARRAMNTGFHECDAEVVEGSPLNVEWVHLKLIRSGDEIAITVRDISEAKAHVKELEKRGNEDVLTGLPNRHWAGGFLPQAIARASRQKEMLALLFVDLDGFKSVNDTMGHEAGDELLCNAALRLRLAVRPHDHVVRLGGDEFVIIIESVAQRSDAAHVAERVSHAFQENFRLSAGTCSIGTSIGISVYPIDGEDAETLLRNADIAMYSVKTSGKGNYCFYDQRFYEALRARHQQQVELRHALDRDQLEVYYQPRVDISTGTTCSMEALVRWRHPVRGMIQPSEFIPLAEQNGLIQRLGDLVIDKVCAQLAAWAEHGDELVPVSINVSPRQFSGANIAKVLMSALERHKVDPRLIEIELTESSMMAEGGEVSETIAAIQKMGIKLLVDDFGTGYSSLSKLQELDFDVLKVDRAFTARLQEAQEGKVFYTAIITMAHSLGMRVVAEGVETLEQIQALKALRCDEIQGYFISEPLPPGDMQPVLPRWFFPSTAS